MNNEVQMIQPLDPEKTTNRLTAIVQQLDEMQVSSPEVLQNWLQDSLMPVLRDIHEEVKGSLFFVGTLDDRVGAIEEGEAGGIDPEDAVLLLAYLTESVQVLENIKLTASLPQLDELIKRGEECVAMVQEYAEGDDGDDEEPPAPTPIRARH